ncbi:hypothetical protein QRX60_30810 [Amycolatopsis mongoliensis]|uniref:Uncharacterized protein n=1 Tax=Amycolatopsis mongoliensis TaxID=715475 RepID=A0A9Y2JJ62_9PSEU|nr:hypothetical protein [Amycolatopsis sp. 4-36]WIX98445.1 hypothetical protein QRX60_30810 [Amycolatopsis sp. 4-36]
MPSASNSRSAALKGADRSDLDVPLADAVARWLATDAREPLRSLTRDGTLQARQQIPRLTALDPITGQVIRAVANRPVIMRAAESDASG